MRLQLPAKSVGLFDHEPARAPLTFLFPHHLQDKIIISHEVPPGIEYNIPYASPTLTRWPGGFFLEQTFATKDYGISLCYFSVSEEIMLIPDAALNFNTIQYTLKGICSCLLRGYGIIPLLQNSYTPLYIPQGRHKVWFKPGQYVFLYIVISTEHLEKLAEDHPKLNTLIQKILTASKDGTMMERMPIDFAVLRIIKEMEQCRKTGAGLHLEMQSIISRLLSVYDDHLRMANQENKTITAQEQAYKINEYITRHFADASKVSNEALSDIFCMSIRSLERIFKKYFFLSPSDYLREVRLHTAHDLLLKQSVSIHEVADKVGYEHVSNFCRDFKKKYGFTPKSKLE